MSLFGSFLVTEAILAASFSLVAYRGLVVFCLKDSGQHFLHCSMRSQPLIFLAPEGEAASQHAVQQNPTGPDVGHLACILAFQQNLWGYILWSACMRRAAACSLLYASRHQVSVMDVVQL